MAQSKQPTGSRGGFKVSRETGSITFDLDAFFQTSAAEDESRKIDELKALIEREQFVKSHPRNPNGR